MNDEQVDTLVNALLKVRRGRTHHWFLVAEAADGRPHLEVDKEEDAARRVIKTVRQNAKDKRTAGGSVTAGEDGTLRFTTTEGSVKVDVLEKIVGRELPKAHPALGAARPWLKEAQFVSEVPEEGGLGIDRRQDAERASKASSKSHKNLSDYSAFLDALDGWHREFGAGVEEVTDLSRARSALDQIEAAAAAWKASHPKKMLEGGDRKRRRRELDRVLGQVAEARRRLLRVKLEGHEVSDEDREALRNAERAWMGERIEQEQEKAARWKEVSEATIDQGLYGEGVRLGEGGTYGYAKLFVVPPPPPPDDGEGDNAPPREFPRLVGKFLTEAGRNSRHDELAKEASWYEAIGPHPNMARCLGVRDLGGERCLVMEALDGGSFESFIADGRRWVDEGKLTIEEYTGALQHTLRGTVRALQQLNEVGLYHHDVKPLNVMIDTRTGEAKLIDLGTVGTGSTQHATPAYRARDGIEPDGSHVDGSGIGMSTFQALEGELPDHRPDRVEVSDEDAIGGTTGMGGLADLPANLDNFAEEDLARIEGTRESLRRQRARRAFAERADDYYEQGEHDRRGGIVPWLGEAHRFVNRLMSPDPDDRPSLQEMLELPFLDDSLLGEEEAQEVLKRIGRLREPPPPTA